jgi:hypothetical protein
VTPIFIPTPYLGSAGGYSQGRDRWGYVFGEKLSKGDPYSDVFGVMMGVGRKTSKKKKRSSRSDFGINFNIGRKRK